MVSKHSSQRPLHLRHQKWCQIAPQPHTGIRFLVNGAPLEQGAAVGSKSSSLVSRDGVTPCRAGATVVIRENDMLTLSDPPIAVLRVQLRFLEADAESG